VPNNIWNLGFTPQQGWLYIWLCSHTDEWLLRSFDYRAANETLHMDVRRVIKSLAEDGWITLATTPRQGTSISINRQKWDDIPERSGVQVIGNGAHAVSADEGLRERNQAHYMRRPREDQLEDQTHTAASGGTITSRSKRVRRPQPPRESALGEDPDRSDVIPRKQREVPYGASTDSDGITPAKKTKPSTEALRYYSDAIQVVREKNTRVMAPLFHSEAEFHRRVMDKFFDPKVDHPITMDEFKRMVDLFSHDLTHGSKSPDPGYTLWSTFVKYYPEYLDYIRRVATPVQTSDTQPMMTAAEMRERMRAQQKSPNPGVAS
jgi:hypothetical protein